MANEEYLDKTCPEPLQPTGFSHGGGEDLSLVPLKELSERLNLPRAFLMRLVKTDSIPCLVVGRQRRFNVTAVRLALVEKASYRNFRYEDKAKKVEEPCGLQE